MYPELAAGAWLAGNYIYHRLTDKDPVDPNKQISIPRIEAGSPMPLIFGRCRIRAPILAYCGFPYSDYIADDNITTYIQDVGEGVPFIYGLNMLFILGIPFDNLNGDNHVHAMWAGELQLSDNVWSLTDGGVSTCRLSDLSGSGNFEEDTRKCVVTSVGDPPNGMLTQGLVEFLNGNVDQLLVDQAAPNASRTTAGEKMAATTGDASLIPGYRGVLSVFLHGGIAFRSEHWIIGTSPTVPTYSFEASSYPTPGLYGGTIGDDANPADVIYNIFTSKLGKLGLPHTLLDTNSFYECAVTLYNEGHGFSFVYESAQTGREMLDLVLSQIDGLYYEDPVTGRIYLKLIRGDYDPTGVPRVHPLNCSELTNHASGGWTDIPNKIRIKYDDRLNGYKTDSVTAQNPANAVGQDGDVIESVLDFPGCKVRDLARDICDRELSARSRPMMKCRAICDRSFYNVVPGDVIELTWPDWHISGMLMRVGGVTRGTLANGDIVLDLIQDFFYAYRHQLISDGILGTLGSFPDMVAP